jgi:hypothetical protein
MLLFLVMQLLFGFSLENRVHERATREYNEAVKPRAAGEAGKTEAQAEFDRATRVGYLDRRLWLTLAVLVNLIAVVAALAEAWLERRPGRPLPRLLIEW